MVENIKNNQEKCCRYLTSIPIERREHAMLLASEVCWDIIDVLRDSGIRGMTAEEIHEKLKARGYPRSTIYAALAQLERSIWIESRRSSFGWKRWGPKEKVLAARIGRNRAKGGRPRKLYRVHILWEFDMDDSFAESLNPIVAKYAPDLKGFWVKTLDKIVEEYKSKEDLRGFFPKDDICPDCNIKHDAWEFLRAISYGIVHFIETEKEWEEFAKKYGFVE